MCRTLQISRKRYKKNCGDLINLQITAVLHPYNFPDVEKKVDELIHEIELLRILKDNKGEPLSNSSKLLNSTTTDKQEKLIIVTLETKLEGLQKVHEQTANEFEEIKFKYEGCLQEIHELQSQMTEARLNHSDLFDSIPSSPITPMSPDATSSSRMSLPSLNKEGKDSLAFINAMMVSRQALHRRAMSLSEMIDKEKKDHAHEEIVQKLQNEIQQLEARILNC